MGQTYSEIDEPTEQVNKKACERIRKVTSIELNGYQEQTPIPHPFMRFMYCLLSLLLSTSAAFATHYFGGYIRVTPVAGQSLAYRITATMYYVPSSGVAVPTNDLTICFGKGEEERLVPRSSFRALPGEKAILINEYVATYTYTGPGVYTIQATGSNRTAARNAGNGEQPYLLQTTILIGAGNSNQTPLLLSPATGLQAAINQRVALSLAGTDPDGDSLTYSLAYPLTTISPASTLAGNCNVASALRPYQFPNDVRQAGTYRLNSQTGLLNWDVPVEQGQYAIAIMVSEWRLGVLISQTHHELILTVVDRGGTPVTPPAYEPAQLALITAIPDADRDGLSLLVSPNPVAGGLIQARLLISRAQSATMELLNSQGHIYKTVHLDQPSKQHQYAFDLAGQPAGLYLIRANSGGRQVVQKVLKQ